MKVAYLILISAQWNVAVAPTRDWVLIMMAENMVLKAVIFKGRCDPAAYAGTITFISYTAPGISLPSNLHQ